MRAYVPDYTLLQPESLAEVLDLLAREPGRYRPIAGGTDLMVLFEAGRLAHKELVSLWKIDELRGIEVSEAHVTLGGLTTYSQAREHDVVRRELPLLAQAAALTGAIAIQNRGTLAGNIANASPAADTPPVLLAYGAEIELASAQGSRWVDYAGFHTGYKHTVMRPHELITRVRVPRERDLVHHYRKVGTRQAQAISKVCLAAVARPRGGTLDEVRIAYGSIAAVPWRASKVEQALRGKPLNATSIGAARAVLEHELAPIDDVRSTAEYRRTVAVNLLVSWLEELARG